jgi:dynein heavy chain
MTLDEYYTISAHGIANIVTERGKKKRNGDVSTEVISLSDWMLEST